MERDGVRYPRDAVPTKYDLNDYLVQSRNLKLFYKEHVSEDLLNPFLSYPDIKNNYSIQVLDLRFQVDHKTPKKFQLFEEYRPELPNNPKMLNYLLY